MAFAINQRDMIDIETRLSGLKVQGSEVSSAAGNRTGQLDRKRDEFVNANLAYFHQPSAEP